MKGAFTVPQPHKHTHTNILTNTLTCCILRVRIIVASARRTKKSGREKCDFFPFTKINYFEAKNV